MPIPDGADWRIVEKLILLADQKKIPFAIGYDPGEEPGLWVNLAGAHEEGGHCFFSSPRKALDFLEGVLSGRVGKEGEGA
jgi:hypothetical protein